MVSPENSNWLFDCGLIDDIPVSVNDFPAQSAIGFYWPSQGLNGADAASSRSNETKGAIGIHEQQVEDVGLELHSGGFSKLFRHRAMLVEGVTTSDGAGYDGVEGYYCTGQSIYGWRGCLKTT